MTNNFLCIIVLIIKKYISGGIMKDKIYSIPVEDRVEWCRKKERFVHIIHIAIFAILIIIAILALFGIDQKPRFLSSGLIIIYFFLSCIINVIIYFIRWSASYTYMWLGYHREEPLKTAMPIRPKSIKECIKMHLYDKRILYDILQRFYSFYCCYPVEGDMCLGDYILENYPEYKDDPAVMVFASDKWLLNYLKRNDFSEASLKLIFTIAFFDDNLRNHHPGIMRSLDKIYMENNVLGGIGMMLDEDYKKARRKKYNGLCVCQMSHNVTLMLRMINGYYLDIDIKDKKTYVVDWLFDNIEGPYEDLIDYTLALEGVRDNGILKKHILEKYSEKK